MTPMLEIGCGGERRPLALLKVRAKSRLTGVERLALLDVVAEDDAWVLGRLPPRARFLRTPANPLPLVEVGGVLVSRTAWWKDCGCCCDVGDDTSPDEGGDIRPRWISGGNGEVE